MVETALPHEEYLDALKRSDESAATAAVERAIADGASPEHVYVRIFQPALVAVGHLWECNEFHVAEEHLATAITRRLMAQFSTYFRAKRPRTGKRLLVGCIEGELHEIGVQMIDDVFYKNGWEVVYLGANVPASDLLSMVDAVQPTLVGLSCTMMYHVPLVERFVRELRATNHEIPIAVGGYPFNSEPELWRRVGADLSGDNALTALQAADQLLEQQATIGLSAMRTPMLRSTDLARPA